MVFRILPFNIVMCLYFFLPQIQNLPLIIHIFKYDKKLIVEGKITIHTQNNHKDNHHLMVYTSLILLYK